MRIHGVKKRYSVYHNRKILVTKVKSDKKERIKELLSFINISETSSLRVYRKLMMIIPLFTSVV